VMAGADDGGSVHACVDLMSSSRVNRGAPLSNPMTCISLFKKLL
jgi:hypothetical protein